MNTLGKILVFLNLLFALVVSAFIIMVFIPRTQWQAGYNTLSTRLVRERESHIKAINERNELEAKKNEEIQVVKNDLKGTNEKLVLLEKVATDERIKRINAEAKAVGDAATIEKLKALVEKSETEVSNIDKLLAAATKRNTDLAKDNKDLAEKKVEFEIKYQSSRERNDQLVIQVQNLLKDNEQMRLGQAAKSSATVRNPPPEDIKGRIKAADQQSGLVTVNLGSDSGLNKGNTLEVFRLAPKPVYLGTLRITDVRPTEAVGRLISSNRRGGLQVGDEVASEILSRR